MSTPAGPVEPVDIAPSEKPSEPLPTTTTEPASLAPPDTAALVKIRTALAAEEAATGKKFVPFLAPAASAVPAPPAPLTADQESKYTALLEHARALTELPLTSAKDAATAPLDDDERIFLTRECLLRYLRASKWDVAGSRKRLEATLVWRREYGLKEHTAEYVSVENETGKQVILGFDCAARPCLYLHPARQNTAQSERQIHHLVWALERIVDLMPAGQESLALLVDFKSSSSSSNPSVGTGRQVLNILQNHYPERLGRALIVNIPWFVWGFFKIINPFIDPLTREKLKFNENLRDHVPPEQLDAKFGGDCRFEYDHAKYWPELVRLAAEKRAAYVARWRAGGCQVGASEFELKGGGKPTSVEEAALVEGVEKLGVKE
ncbi:CRAL/TRIO domain-containing protein [Geopyxis carbonaria]|nr:CRAL/TRIO domain-containing protein [Geopyxis carbonaria]